MLRAGVAPNAALPFYHDDITGDRWVMATALYRAAGFGDDNMVRVLLENGASLATEGNQRAICAAAGRGRISVLEVLRAFAATPNPSSKCIDGASPLALAQAKGHDRAAAFLREMGGLSEY